jgi:DNA-binding NtrC family response regulator
MSIRIALVEDEKKLLDLLIFNLKDQFDITGFGSAEDFLAASETNRFHILVTDVRLPGMDGLKLLSKAKNLYPDLPVIVITAYGSIDQAVEAVKNGAYDYLKKPVTIEKMGEVITRAKKFRTSIDNKAPSFPQNSRFLTEDKSTRDQLELAAKVSSIKAPVLVLGETGTGKELIAEMIHRASGRKGKLVKINCAAIPAELLEGELFGYRKGAFTGAHVSHAGKLKLADKGTLFLDEIAEMPEPLQAKLLRVLEEEIFYPIGDNTLCKVDIRVITATNKNLKEEIEQSRFRPDLYYRLAVVPIRIPPLRERPGDIPLLAQSFLKEIINRGETEAKSFHERVFQVLGRYNWPGNVRELRNIVTHMALLASSATIQVQDIPAQICNEESGCIDIPDNYDELKESKKILKNEAVAELEIRFLKKTLSENEGNVSRSAQAVRMDRRLFQNLLKKYNIRK